MDRRITSIYDSVTYESRYLLREDFPGIFHSSFCIDGFPLAKRLDLFAVVEPGVKALFFDVGKEELCGTEALDRIVEEYNIPWSAVEIVISHFHDDHDGCLQYCVDKGVTRVFHGPRVAYSDERKHTFLQRSGIAKNSDSDLEVYSEFFMQKNRFSSEVEAVLQEVEEGSVFSIAGYNFEVVYTPGHTPEHISLYEPNKKIMFAGDFVLDAAPGVMQFISCAHMLEQYLDKLTWTKQANLQALFMSHHRALFSTEEINALIGKQIASYDHSLHKVIAQFSFGEWLDAYEVACRYCSSYTGGLQGLASNPRIRKITNMYAYLDCLEGRGFLEKKISTDGREVYFLV